MKKLRSWVMANFTLHRWALNPFQMYGITFLVATSIAQIQLGATPNSVLADLPRLTLLSLSIPNVIGGVITLYGLHLRELETALWVEVWGYVILVFVLGTYLMLLKSGQVNVTASYGFALSEAFVYAALHRGIQILLYKRACRRRGQLVNMVTEATFLQQTISRIEPHAPVIGEGENPL